MSLVTTYAVLALLSELASIALYMLNEMELVPIPYGVVDFFWKLGLGFAAAAAAALVLVMR